MRAKPASVIGWASESRWAAACTSSSVSASARVQSCFPIGIVIAAALLWFGIAGGDDADAVAPQGVGDKWQASLHHAEQPEAGLSLEEAWIEPLDGEGTDAVVAPVARRLCVVLLEVTVPHTLPIARNATNVRLTRCPGESAQYLSPQVGRDH